MIVGDDASTDGTAAVAEGFGERFHVVRCPENRGAAAARNAAIEAGEGEMLAFLDADDHWLPEFLSEQLALYERSEALHPGTGIVASDALVSGPTDISAGTFRDRAPFEEPLTLTTLLEGCPIVMSGVLIPRAAIEQAGGFSTVCLRAQDHDLFIRLLELGYHVAYNTKPLTVYRVHEGSVSTDNAEMAHYSALVYRRALDRGRLGRRDRRVASRRLRVHQMAEELALVRERRHSGQRTSPRQFVRVALRGTRLALDDPRRSLRLASRSLRGEGGRLSRITYQHNSLISEQPSQPREQPASEKTGETDRPPSDAQ